MAGIRTDYPGFEAAVDIEDHVAEESNLERRENKRADARRRQGIQKFPMHVHKPEGLHRVVENDDDLADALRKGWKADIRECLAPESDQVAEGDENSIFNLPIKKALKRVKEDLAKLEADEANHGARADVMAAIAVAKDNAKPAAKAAPAKAAKTAKAKK
jgi:hypothetical protein